MMLFSSISPNYEKNLKDELFSCFKYVGIPFETLEKMPIRDRKIYIIKHNLATEKEKQELDRMSNGGGDVIDGSMIDSYTDVEQQKYKNSQR